MEFLIYILAFVLILSIIVFVHELGHFITAKMFGVYCGEFSIGMGPVLFKKQGKETQYSFRAIPIGGFVSMAGEADDTKKDVEVSFERTINGIKPWQKIIVMSAGIFMNVLLAWCLFVGITMYQGKVVEDGEPIFENITEGSIADQAGFEDGDYIVSMRDEEGKVFYPETFTDIAQQLNLSPQEYEFEVKRGEETLLIQAEAKKDENGAYMLGVSATKKIRDIMWTEAFSYGTRDTIDNSTLIFKSLGKLVQGENLDQLSGPVGIFKVTGEAVSGGILVFLRLLALLSLNIGIFNAIPIPILDGGRVVITIIEKIVGRELNEKVLNVAMSIGVILLVALMVYATFNDITKLL